MAERLDALAEAADAAAGRLPAEAVVAARGVVARAGERRRLSAEHTVVALAGSTGSGKSSLFNAVSGLDLARVGLRRPTTGEPMACVWGAEGAGLLLDWLGIPRRHQVLHESALDSWTPDSLRGLVLLDLPDHDSTEVTHRVEVDRLVGLVDLLVWVLDPQKYADLAVHARYLRPLAAHAAVTVIVLNQVDLLPEGDRERCVTDLHRILVDDGLDGVPVLCASARTGEGIDGLVALLRDTVQRRRAADDRLAADATTAARDLLDRAGMSGMRTGHSADEVGVVSGRSRDRLVEALAGAAGVDAVADAVSRSHVMRARAATGWPPTRWLARLRPDPVRRLRLDRAGVDPALVRTSLPEAIPVQRAQADSGVRQLGHAAAEGIPEPWAAAIRRTAREAGDRLPDTLDRAVAGADLEVGYRPRWWAVVGALQWVLVAAAAVGLLWLVALFVLSWLRLPEPPTPEWGVFPVPTVLLLGGALAGLVLALMSGLVARVGARRRAALARRRLREAVGAVADQVVVAPVVDELERLRVFVGAAQRAIA